MPLPRRIFSHILSNPMELVWPAVTFGIVLLIGILVRALVLRALRAWNDRTQSRPGLILMEALRGPTRIWAFILAAHIALQASDLPLRATSISTKTLAALWIFSLTFMCMRLARDMVRYYGGQVPGALPVTTLTQNLAQLAVFILGAVILLKSALEVEVTPILTALGVGGLAVALALQDTLSNLFGGFYIAVAGQIRPGDYIKLNSGEEGYVADIGWRSTMIRALANNMIIVPNAKLAQAIVTNYYLPEKRLGASVSVGVGYGSDPDVVERALLDVVAKAAGELPGLLTEPPPSVVLDSFGDSSLNYNLNFQVAEFANQFAVRAQLRRRILLKFRELGIDIPFPTRTVQWAGGDPRSDGENPATGRGKAASI